jgi:hypothetical protein
MFGVKGAPIRYEIIKKRIPSKQAAKVHDESIDYSSALPGSIM